MKVKNKGRRGELAAVEEAKRLGFHEAKSEGFQFRGGEERPDLFLSEKIWCEVKNRGVTNVRAALDQACADRPLGKIPCALTKVPGKGPKTGKQFILSVYFDDALCLAEALLNAAKVPF